MEDKTKFKIKTFLYYLVVEPWTEKLSLPNFRTILWVVVLFSILFKVPTLLLVSAILGGILHLVHEYRSGKFIYWYRQHTRKKLGLEENKKEQEDVRKMP